MAAIGSAVGIGNIWRFSYVLGENGGGAYLIPYLFAVFAFALPLMILELSVGRRMRGTVVSAFRTVQPIMQVAGWIITAIVFIILSYYVVITGWILAYVFSSIYGGIAPFEQFTSSNWPIISFLFTCILIGLIVSLGVKDGIERVAKFLMPLCFLVLLVLALYSSTLDGFPESLAFMFSPDFTVLTQPSLWSAAFGQAFFSLSVGFGVLIIFGAYLTNDIHIPKASLIITLADLAVALVAGLVIFSVVYTFNLEPALGAQLAFSTLPLGFDQMVAGEVVAFFFFLVLFIAALTSAVSMLEVCSSTLAESTRLSRNTATSILGVLLVIIGLPSALSYSSIDLHFFGTRFLDMLDETIGSLGLPFAAIITSIVFSWHLGRKDFQSEIGLSPTLSTILLYMLRLVVPGVLIATLLMKFILDIDFTGWHFLPGLPFIGSLGQIIFLLVLGSAILLAVILVSRRRK